MSNKDMILQNNAQLVLHKQDILDLPTIAEIAAEASAGQHIWKKSHYTPEESISGLTFTATFPVLYDVKDYCNITNQNYDVSRIDDFIDFYEGFHRDDDASCYFEKNNGNNLYYINNTVGYEVAKATSDRITFTATTTNSVERVYSFTCDSEKTLKPAIGQFVDYVVSDNPNAYPDGGVQDGYWYERIDKLQKGLNILERREDGSASKICLNYDGETLDSTNGLGTGAGSKTVCGAGEVEIIADTLNDAGSSGSISFYIGSNCEKAKLKIDNSIHMLFTSATIQHAKKLWISDVITIDFSGTATYKYGLGSSLTETIYAQPASKPSGWDSRWNYYGTSAFSPVVWGVTEAQFDAM